MGKCECIWIYLSETHIWNGIDHDRVKFYKKSIWLFINDIFLQNYIRSLKIKHIPLKNELLLTNI